MWCHCMIILHISNNSHIYCVQCACSKEASLKDLDEAVGLVHKDRRCHQSEVPVGTGGADPNHPFYWSDEWVPPLYWACWTGYLEIVKTLVPWSSY